jgi:uncharacterized Zn finger protein
VTERKEVVPYSLYVDCPDCNEETLHRVLKGKLFTGGEALRVDATVKCSVCGRVHVASVKEARPIKVPVVISWMGESERTRLEFGADDEIAVGDVLQHEYPLLVTAVETKERREGCARARDVVTLWTKRYDRVRVNFSISKGIRTTSAQVEAAPDEEFCVGDIVDFNRAPAVIHTIKVRARTLDKGCAAAGDIVRVYCRAVRSTVQRGRGRPQSRR